MFKTIVSTATLQGVFGSVSVLVDRYRIQLDEESLSIRAVGPANVGMADLALDTAAFEFYEAHGGIIGVSLSRLEEVAGMAGAGDLVRLTLDGEARRLNVHIDGLSYMLTLINPDSIHQEPDIPDLDLTANIALGGTHLDRGIKAADMVSDHVRLRVGGAEETLRVETEGDADDVDLSLPPADLISIEAGAADSLFSLDYLEDVDKAIPTDTEVTVKLDEEFPVKLRYRIAEGMGTITCMFAPRIQSG